MREIMREKKAAILKPRFAESNCAPGAATLCLPAASIDGLALVKLCRCSLAATQNAHAPNGSRAHHPYSHTIRPEGLPMTLSGGEQIGRHQIDLDSVEALAIEKSGPRLFTNLTGKDAVGVIDRKEAN